MLAVLAKSHFDMLFALLVQLTLAAYRTDAYWYCC